MIIKILLIAGICLAALTALRGDTSAAKLVARRLTAAVFVFIAAVSVLFPDVVTWAAQLVGVAQGSNLVLYALVVAFLLVSIALYQRIHALEEKLTHLARELALRTPKPPAQSSSDTKSQPAA